MSAPRGGRRPRKPPKTPGELIRAEIDKQGATQQEVAEAIGVTATHLSRVMTGRARLSAAYAVEVATYLGMNASTLIRAQAETDAWKARQRA